jgi:hypothetical protein
VAFFSSFKNNLIKKDFWRSEAKDWSKKTKIFLLIYFLMVMGFELRDLHLWHTWAMLPSCFAVVISEKGLALCPSCPRLRSSCLFYNSCHYWDDRCLRPCPGVGWDGISWTPCPGWSSAKTVLISASQVAKITGVSHRHPAKILISDIKVIYL